MKLIKAKFSVNDSPAFDGFYDPTVKWNGFVCPLFSSDVVGEIFKHFPIEPEDCDNIKAVVCEFEPGKHSLLFAVNNFNWCWELYKDDAFKAEFIYTPADPEYLKIELMIVDENTVKYCFTPKQGTGGIVSTAPIKRRGGEVYFTVMTTEGLINYRLNQFQKI